MKLVLQEKTSCKQAKERKNSMQYETLSDDTNGEIAARTANKNIQIKRYGKVEERETFECSLLTQLPTDCSQMRNKLQ
jgi:hypothetical protein